MVVVKLSFIAILSVLFQNGSISCVERNDKKNSISLLSLSCTASFSTSLKRVMRSRMNSMKFQGRNEIKAEEMPT